MDHVFHPKYLKVRQVGSDDDIIRKLLLCNVAWICK